MQKWLLVGVTFFLLLLIGVAAVWFAWVYPVFLKPNDPAASEMVYLEIPTGSDYQEVRLRLSSAKLVSDVRHFDRCADLLKYPNLVKPGRYRIDPTWNNLTLVRHLRSGQQAPVRLTFNNVRTLPELAGKVARYLEPDSMSFTDAFFRIRELLPDSPVGVDSTLCLFLPNTYELYWNTSPVAFLERMHREYKLFWTEARQSAAARQGLTPVQAYILASIVEKETLVQDEKPRIAGVYLNRLQRGMLLQADPTVVFALGDFEKERVLFRDLEVDSPYNTYKYPGLPPGPIFMPDTRTIDAVLQAEAHDYLYFCARPDNTGRHAFAKTLDQHNANARKFQQWLNQRGVYR